MAVLEGILRRIAPGFALARAEARLALDMIDAQRSKVSMRYDAATPGRRGASWTPNALDADASAAQRARLAMVARDMIRNTPFATRAQQVIANNVVGDGIIPKITGGSETQRGELQQILRDHLDTVAVDAAGRNNLYGLERLATNTIVESGEVLIRRRRRRATDGLPLNFQIEVLEPDFLDASLWGDLTSGNRVRDGIEYDTLGRRVAYYLFDQHPGARGWQSRMESRRVSARDVLHVFRSDRPGQNRGVSWFAPVALRLQDLADHQDAQLLRQKIAACFTAFRVRLDEESDGTNGVADRFESLEPGRIEELAPGEDIKFASPPGVETYDEFTRAVLREAAAGLGITYEALTGDLTGVNFSSGRMGRMEMDRNVSSWQWTMLVPQMLQPLAGWTLEELAYGRPPLPRDLRIDWVPPARIIVDPSREIPAMIRQIRGGLATRSEMVRRLGYDPEQVEAEMTRDNRVADESGFVFDSDARRVSLSGGSQGGANFMESEGDTDGE